MNIIVVTDDNGGMMFNKRRQSQDRVLREEILKITADSRLWMNEYSAGQFEDQIVTEKAGLDSLDQAGAEKSNGAFLEHAGADNIYISESFLEEAGKGDFCFVENAATSAYEDRIEGIWLFRWNRSYPGDFFFDIDIGKAPWKLKEARDFPGYSHEKISLEVYEVDGCEE